MKAFAKQRIIVRCLISATTVLVLSNCTPPRFSPAMITPEEIGNVSPPPSNNTPDPEPGKISDLLLQTQMNVPVEFTAQVTGPKSFVDRLIAAGSDGAVWALTPNGRLDVLDPKSFRMRYTPNANFRGEDFGLLFLIEGGKFVSSAVVRIQVDNALIGLKPALAVRGTGCIMCHASISSNVITDFGYGDSYFFGGPELPPVDHTSIYADDKTDPAWKYIRRLGDEVIVPRASTAHLSKVGAPTLADYLAGVLAASSYPEVNTTKVTEVDRVYIGAPAAAKILLSARMVPGLEAVKYIPDFNQPSTPPALIRKLGSGLDHYTNDPGQEFVCSGDLVVDGVVYLNRPVIRSETGCRIYATGSVFVTGPITYSGGNEERRNLQIVSARSINMGLGRNTCGTKLIGSDSLLNRLQSEYRRRYFETRGEPNKTVQQKLDDIVADYNKVGYLLDASCDTTGREVGFERLILNAPIVFSRYTGGFRGSVIAEIALMSLDQFIFEFDPVFTKEAVLPLLSPEDYLVVE